MRHPPLRSDASFCPLGLIDKPTYPRDCPTLLNRLQRRYQSSRFNFLPRISRMNTDRTKTHRRAHHPCPSVPSVVKFGPGMFRIAVPNLSSGQNVGVDEARGLGSFSANGSSRAHVERVVPRRAARPLCVAVDARTKVYRSHRNSTNGFHHARPAVSAPQLAEANR